MTETQTIVQPARPELPPIRLVGPEGVPVWGLTGEERLRRMAARLGADVRPWSGNESPAGRVLLIRRDSVLGADVLAALLRVETGMLLDEDGASAVAAMAPVGRAGEIAPFLERARWIADQQSLPLPALRPRELASIYDEKLRKRRGRPIARLVDVENRPATEWALYNGAYKGVTDIVTKYAWPFPAFHLAQLACLLRLSPNIVTLAGMALTVAATILFARGEFGWGLVCAWGMALLDTVDGKLARVTITSSRIGNVLDHGTDLIHPPFWYAAWLMGLSATGALQGDWGWIAWLTIGGYFAGRAQEGWFIARHKMELHVWKSFDSWFRLVCARRNPNMILLTVFALAGMPYIAIASVAVWTALTLGIHMLRIVQAEFARPIRSWMEP